MLVNRGGVNIDYVIGYEIESRLFKEYKPMLLKILHATDIELTTRGILDKNTSTDATAVIENNVYGISLRFRNGDYNSFTLNRHISDKYSEIHKWLKERNTTIKPAYYVQISDAKDYYKMIRINIDAFANHIRYLIKHNQLESCYNANLKAYEFKLKDLSDTAGVFYTKIKKSVYIIG
jgi:hypothetical protein